MYTNNFLCTIMTSGIYLISFPNTTKVYIGQSLNIASRFKEHLNLFKKGEHTKKMMCAYTNYGCPEIEVLEECVDKFMNPKENYYINLYNSVDDGFNTLRSASGGVSLGSDNGTSIYTDEQYINIFKYIVNNPSTTLVDVSTNLGVSYRVVKNMSLGITQKWLTFMFPEDYSLLLSRIGTRNNKGENYGASTYSNEQISGCLLTAYINPLMPYKEIAIIHEVSESAVASACTGKQYLWLKDAFPIEWESVLNNAKTKRVYSRSAAARGITYPSIISPIGNIYNITNVSAFSKEHSLDTGSLNRLLNYKANSVKGWKRLEKTPA